MACPYATFPCILLRVTKMIFLSEKDVQQLFPMEAALQRIEASFVAQAHHQAASQVRQRMFLTDVSLHYMAGAWAGENLLGMKIYTVSRGSLRFVVLLYDATQGELLAVIEADHLGRIRTGAASGVATKHLSRPDSATLGLVGSGRQARTQLHAISLVRRLDRVRVYSRDPRRREAFCNEVSEQFRLEVTPAESAEAAIRSSAIVVTATSSQSPVLSFDWLAPGTHINAIGANIASRRELDDATLLGATSISVDLLEQAKVEAGDLIQGFRDSPERWESVTELKDIVAGKEPGRQSSEDITIFKSTGIALWDIAAAGTIYYQAVKMSLGKEIELSRGLV
jgi:alanine dehydrogenase